MATIYDVLAHIGQRLPHLNKVKAFKLAYYAQAWHATWQGRPLYAEGTEAWKHGPVCRAGWRAVNYAEVHPTEPLSEDESGVVDAVLRFYGPMSGWELAKLSHDEDPWREARGDVPEEERCENEVTVASMRRYYTRKSMRGEAVPERPSAPGVPVDREVARKVAHEQLDRWHGALRLLADR